METKQQSTKSIDEQALSEAKHFDDVYATADEQHRRQQYLVPEIFINQVIDPKNSEMVAHEYAFSRLGKLEGKSLLDYGAGDGWNTICFAKAKAKVWAFDISEKGVNLIQKKAKANGVSESVIAEVQDAYKTHYPDDMFDIIYGGGILHHLDIEAAGQEIKRILCSEGVAVFYEPIRETKIMDIIKSVVLFFLKRKPSEVTDDEDALTHKRINLLKSYFKVVNYRYFNVLSSANVLINSEALKRFLLWVDYILIKYFPGYKILGRTVIVELKEPIK